MHRLILHNDEILPASALSVSPGQVGLLNGWGVFSTLRVADGVLFAFERHWARMQKDAGRLHVPFPSDAEWLRQRLLRLVEANEAQDATLRVAVVRNHGGPFEGPGIERDFDLIAFTADLTEWPASAALALKAQARHAASEFAGAKVLSWSFNLTMAEEARQRGFDEVVLLNERGEVSECTSANIFMIEGSRVWCPPIASGCLPGITRALVLEEIRIPGIAAAERVLRPEDLERANCVFITSSTRDLLPVSRIEGLQIRNTGNAIFEALRAEFCSWRDRYVASAHAVGVLG